MKSVMKKGKFLSIQSRDRQRWFGVLLVLSLTIFGGSLNQQAKAAAVIYDCRGKSIPESECDALVDFYNSTKGDLWTSKTNWFNPDPCTWEGVGCAGDPPYLTPTNVTTLMLPDNNVAGVLPASIGDFPSMAILSMTSNSIGGPFLTEITQLSSLHSMFFSGNNLSGPLPTEIGDMDSLGQLYLTSNQITGPLPASLGDMDSLFWLVLAYNDIDGTIPPEIGSIADLEALALAGNSLTGNVPSELGNLGALTVLSLSNNALDGEVPAELGNLSNLETLYLSENSFTGPLPQNLTNLGALEWLSYNTTSVCEPQNGSFQAWLSGVTNVSNSGILPCVATFLFEDDFETNDFSLWTRYNDGKGYLYTCTQAAINGTYGACVERGSNDKRKQLIDDSPAYETTFSARFNFDINSLSMGEGVRFRFMQFKMDAVRPAFIVMKFQGGNYYIQLNTLLDDLTKVKSGWHLLPNTVRVIEVDWQQSSGADANDGYAELLINDLSVETLSGLDNSTISISSFRMGFTSRLVGKSIAGTFYIDDVATSTDIYIGPP